MYSFDTSSIIHAWDNYPISNNHFSSLWEDWIAEETKKEIFVIPKIAFEEIHEKSQLRGWLKEKNIKKLPMTREILNKAMEIRNSLGIEEKYGKNGVNENDILIIATAAINQRTLITEEAKQLELPKEKLKYKIPAVCRMSSVRNINFTELLKQQ